MNNYLHLAQSPLIGTKFGALVLVLMLWSLAWKGWSMWLSARRGDKVWFILLLVANTLGILDIIYIFAVAKRKDTK